MKSRPNFLLISADQWRGDCVGAAGHPVVQTPHADALAADGTLFLNHYAGAAPCGPARAGLYTGLYQMNHRVVRNGAPLDNRFDNIARAARRAGYDPTLFGYNDVTIDPRTTSENDPRLSNDGAILPGFSVRELLPEHGRPWLSWLKARGHDDVYEETVHLPVGAPADSITTAPPCFGRDETETAFLTESFLRWMDEQQNEAPWFAHISFLRPHPPFVVPEPFNTMYDPEHGPEFVRAQSHELEAAVHPYIAFQLNGLNKAKFVPGPSGPVRDWGSRDYETLRAIYFGMITEVDTQLGRIFAALRRTGHWDNTVVILTSDHGEMMGDHWSLGKGGYHDASYRIPLIVRDPTRNKRGIRVNRFTEASDVFPTLLDMMAQEPTNGLDGRSLLPLIDGKKPDGWRDEVHWEFDFRGVTKRTAERELGLESTECNMAVIRSRQLKYVHFGALPPLLFDLENDPGELDNVVDHPDYLQARIGMAEKLLSWRSGHLDQTLALSEVTGKGLAKAPFLR